MNRAFAAHISQLHGNLPVLIAFVASAIEIEQHPNGLGQLLKERKGQHLQLNRYARDEGVWNCNKAIASLFDPALKSLSEDAKNLLIMLVFLGPGGIREDLLLC